MTPDMRELLRRKYDSYLAFSLYNQKSDRLDLIIELMLPLIYIVVVSEFYELDEGTEDELVLTAVTDLYVSLHDRTCRHSDHNKFNTYYYRRVWRVMLAALKEMNQVQEGDGIPAARLVHPFDVEADLYLEQLPSEVMDHVLDKIRFVDNEWLACQYIASRLLTDRKIVKRVLVVDLKITDPDFFISYVTVLLRSTLYQIREEASTFHFLAKRYNVYGYESTDRVEDNY